MKKSHLQIELFVVLCCFFFYFGFFFQLGPYQAQQSLSTHLLYFMFAGLVTGGRIMSTLIIASLFWGASGIITGVFTRFTRQVSFFFNILLVLPLIAFFPLLILWVGQNQVAFILFCSLLVGVYLALPIREAIIKLPKDYVIVADNLQFTPYMWLVEVIIPTVLPYFFTGLRVSMSIATIYFFLVEIYSLQSGLAYAIYMSFSQSQTLEALIAMLFFALYMLTLRYLIHRLQVHLMPWEYYSRKQV